MPRCRIVLCAALAAALAAPALSADNPGLSLDRAVDLALARSPEVLAAQARVEASRGRTLQLRSRPEPALDAGLEGLPLPGLGKEGDEVEVHLGLEQVFEYPGKRALRSEMGRRGEDMAQAELDRVRLLLAAEVKRAYWAAVFARGAVEALERSSARLDVLAEDLQAKYRTGAAAYADVLRARAEKARLRNQVLDQSRERRAAELALAGLLGLPPGETPALTTPLPFAPIEADAAALAERARESLPSFRLARLRNAQADSAVALAGLGRRPDFVAGFLLPSVRPNGWGVTFGLTMPFLRPGRNRGLVLEATAEAEAGRQAAAALERRVRTAVETAFAAAKSAEAQVMVYEKSLLRELEDELAIELDYFRYGKTETLGLLDLHRTFVLAQVERLRALYLYNLALADLEVAGETAD
ncbi:MAG TPA: TolC family protein [Candidatus Aminicenantes bacterium]|nr:TolC family protein [Candidatus Aminicenantes bacterium]